MLFDTFQELDRRVKRKARADALCSRFMGVPDVGEISALSFKAAVEDPTRFEGSRVSASNGGEKDNPGRISHAGDRDVRATLCAAANAMLMRSIA